MESEAVKTEATESEEQLEAEFAQAFAESAESSFEKKEEPASEEPEVKAEEQQGAVEGQPPAEPTQEEVIKGAVADAVKEGFSQIRDELKPKGEPAAEPQAKETPAPLNLKDDPEFKDFFEEYDYFAGPMEKMVQKIVDSRISSTEALPSKEELLKMVKDEVHFNTITIAHPDFEELRDSGELKKFVDSQTGEEKARLEKVYTEGNYSDVISMVDAYKKTKVEQPPANPQRDEKIRNLTAVKTKVTPVAPASSKGKEESYEDAWKNAVAGK